MLKYDFFVGFAQRARLRVARVFALGLVAACASLAWSGTARAVTAITITGVEKSCTRHIVKFSKTGTFAADEVVQLWRVSGVVATMAKSAMGTSLGSTILDQTFLPRSGETFSYRVTATRPGGSTVTSNGFGVSVSGASCGMPSVMETRILRVSCRPGTNPFLSLDLDRLLYDTSEPTSVTNYFDEVSNGLTSFEGGHETLRILPASFSCGDAWDGYRWTGLVPAATRNEIRNILYDLNRDNMGAPDRWLVIIDRAITGDTGVVVDGVPAVFIGGGMLRDDPAKGKRAVLHELGHTYGAYHAGRIRCTNIPFPSSHNVTTSCDPNPGTAAAAYGDYHDPMGTGGYHYSAFNKYLFGWIPDSDVTSVTLTSPTAFSQTVTLRDAAWEDGPRLIKIRYYKVLVPEYFFLEYRRQIGFNQPGMIGDPTADSNHPVSASVYIRYFPTSSLTCGAATTTPCFTDDRHASTWLPMSQSSIKLIRMGQDPYWDPGRKIRITMLSRSGRDTTLKIEHEVE
jgi:hypothetical protein